MSYRGVMIQYMEERCRVVKRPGKMAYAICGKWCNGEHFRKEVAAHWDADQCRGIFFFSSRRRHTRLQGDWSSDVCSSDLDRGPRAPRSRVRPDAPARARVPARSRHAAAARPPDLLALAAVVARAARPDAGSEIGRASCRERV